VVEVTKTLKIPRNSFT